MRRLLSIFKQCCEKGTPPPEFGYDGKSKSRERCDGGHMYRQICDGHHRRRLNKLLWRRNGARSLGGFHEDQKHHHLLRRVHVRFDGWHSDRRERQ